MTRTPSTIGPDEFAMAALDVMEQKKITSLVVTYAAARWRRLCICTICGERRCCKSGCWLLALGFVTRVSARLAKGKNRYLVVGNWYLARLEFAKYQVLNTNDRFH